MKTQHPHLIANGHLAGRLPTLEEIGYSQENISGTISPGVRNQFKEMKPCLNSLDNTQYKPLRTGEVSNLDFLAETLEPLSSSPINYNPNHPQIKKFIQKYGNNYLRL